MNPLQVALGTELLSLWKPEKVIGISLLWDRGVFFLLNTIQFKDYSPSAHSIARDLQQRFNVTQPLLSKTL